MAYQWIREKMVHLIFVFPWKKRNKFDSLTWFLMCIRIHSGNLTHLLFVIFDNCVDFIQKSSLRDVRCFTLDWLVSHRELQQQFRTRANVKKHVIHCKLWLISFRQFEFVQYNCISYTNCSKFYAAKLSTVCNWIHVLVSHVCVSVTIVSILIILIYGIHDVRRLTCLNNILVGLVSTYLPVVMSRGCAPPRRKQRWHRIPTKYKHILRINLTRL